jgi:hypothetical protein
MSLLRKLAHATTRGKDYVMNLLICHSLKLSCLLYVKKVVIGSCDGISPRVCRGIFGEVSPIRQLNRLARDRPAMGLWENPAPFTSDKIT